jgi:hypothetical protein
VEDLAKPVEDFDKKEAGFFLQSLSKTIISFCWINGYEGMK